MAKNQNQTVETKASVEKFLNSVLDEQKRMDCFKLVKIMKKLTGFEPKMWGPAIVGFGSYHYKYESGREGDSPLAGFSPRKQSLTIYMGLPANKRESLLKKLGKHKSSKVCLYVKKLDDLDQKTLEEIIVVSANAALKKYPQER